MHVRDVTWTPGHREFKRRKMIARQSLNILAKRHAENDESAAWPQRGATCRMPSPHPAEFDLSLQQFCATC